MTSFATRIEHRVATIPSGDRIWYLGFAPAVLLYTVVLAATGNLGNLAAMVAAAFVGFNYWPKAKPYFRPLAPFVMFLLAYDALRFITPTLHALNPPMASMPYAVEAWLFGITDSATGKVITPPEWFVGRYTTWLDLPTAFAYAFYIYEVFVVGIAFLILNRAKLSRFAWAFVWVNVFGWVVYYALPVAPPWYVLAHGFDPVDVTVASNPARLAAVDDYLGISYFRSFYAQSANVFAAWPSLHGAYPLVCWFYGRSLLPRTHWLWLGGFWLLVSFAAVYLCHHYVVDLLLGWAIAGLAWWVVEKRGWATVT